MHPNVVELMGYHDSTECMALVYEFVERGSLYDNLHRVCNKHTMQVISNSKIA